MSETKREREREREKRGGERFILTAMPSTPLVNAVTLTEILL